MFSVYLLEGVRFWGVEVYGGGWLLCLFGMEILAVLTD